MAGVEAFPLQSPIGRTALRNLRLHLRKYAPSAGLGPHLRRRMGQSLEFREYRDYSFGDDIRTVDWAASARKGGRWDLVAKSFEAEERRTLIILLDCRPAMRLPRAVPKLGVAAWITASLLEVALAEQDRVIAAPVFAKSPHVLKVDGPSGVRQVQHLLREHLTDELSDEDWREVPTANLSGLDKHLRPAAAVVLVTDALCDDPNGALSAFARRAQKSFRSFHVMEIDSWPHERAVMRERPFRLKPLAGKQFAEQMFDAPDSFLEDVAHRMAERRESLRKAWNGAGIVWPQVPLTYPDKADFDTAAAQTWFRQALPRSAAWATLMSRSG